MDLRVTFLGTGDPFGTGGRLQSAVLLEHAEHRLLLDCGMTTMVALARANIDPATLDGVVVTHWHGDHFGGVPLLVIDALIGGRHGAPRQNRGRPLVVAGPAGTAARLRDALTLFNWSQPRTSDADPLAHIVTDMLLGPGQLTKIGPFVIEALAVVHTPEALGVRVTVAGHTIAYSGDTAWTDTLIALSAEADLFICQAYTYRLEHPIMLSCQRLERERARFTCKRLILTHVGGEMEAHLADVTLEVAWDGQTVTL